MINRRKFIFSSVFSSAAVFAGKLASGQSIRPVKDNPVVISTWDAGLSANRAAWEVLGTGGRALDAVEKGVMDTESAQSYCVGLGANPDRDGFVTLDASIMDEF